MKLRHWLSAAAGVMALGALSATANAAPLGSAPGALQAAATGENTLAQTVHYGRRCWRHRGHWHCRRGYRRYYRHYYSDPYYYGPGFSFYFGGGHRHGHHRHHRHHRHR